jgi:hypothetical protein
MPVGSYEIVGVGMSLLEIVIVILPVESSTQPRINQLALPF